MTVSTTSTKTVVTGNGSTTVFNITGWTPKSDGSDILAEHYNGSSVKTLPVLDTDFTYDSVTGQVTFPKAGSSYSTLAAAGSGTVAEKITFRRDTTKTQSTDLDNQSGAFLEVIESMVDRSVKMIQEMDETLSRCLRLPTTLSPDATTVELPYPVGDKFFAYDGVTGAVKLVDGPSGSSSTVIADGATTSRTLSAYFADVANVINFGADKSGATDSTSAIQAAIDSLASTGGLVYLPAGTYLVDVATLIYKPGVHVRGAGKGATIITSPTKTTYGIAIPYTATRCSIDDLTWDGGASSNGGGSGHRCVLVNSDATGTGAYGTHVDMHSFTGPGFETVDWSVGVWNARGDHFEHRGSIHRDIVGTAANTGYGISTSGRFCKYWGAAINDPADRTGRHALYNNDDAYEVHVPFFTARGYANAPFINRLESDDAYNMTYGILKADQCNYRPESNGGVFTFRNVGGYRNKGMHLGALMCYKCSGHGARIEDTDGVSIGSVVLTDHVEGSNYNVAAGGTADAITITVAEITAMVAGITVNVTIASNNTGSATLQVGALPAATILDDSGNALTAGALVAATDYNFAYDGQYWILQGNNSVRTYHRVHIEDCTNITTGDLVLEGLAISTVSGLFVDDCENGVIGRVVLSGTKGDSVVQLAGTTTNFTVNPDQVIGDITGSFTNGEIYDASSGNNRIDGFAVEYDGDATPSASPSSDIVINDSGANTITDFDNAQRDMQLLKVAFATANTTIQHSSSGGIYLQDKQDASVPTRGVMFFIRRGTRWIEVGRNFPAYESLVTASDGDATPSVDLINRLRTANTGATTITALDDGVEGQVVVIQCDDANTTIQHGTSGDAVRLSLGRDLKMANNSNLAVIKEGSTWKEIAYSHNRERENTTVNYVDDATPSVENINHIRVTGTGAYNITGFDGADHVGQRVTLKAGDGNVTLTHNASTFVMSTGANVSLSSGNMMEFIYDDGAWHEQWRNF
jgi:hypothetical protein